MVSAIFNILLFIQKIKASMDSRKTSKKLGDITNKINIGMAVLSYSNKTLKLLCANDGFYNLVQYSKSELDKLYKTKNFSLLSTDDMNIVNEIMVLFKDTQNHVSVKLKIQRKDLIYIDVLATGVIEQNKDNTYIYCGITDISYQEKTTRQLRHVQNRYKLFLEISHDMYFDINPLTGEIFASKLLKQEFKNLIPEVYSDKTFFKLWNTADEDKELFLHTIQQCQIQKERKEIKIRLINSRNERRWCLLSIRPIFEKETLIQILGRIEDIDDEEKEKAEILLKAQTDTLTGLFRKGTFLEKAQEYLDTPHAGKSALIFIDLDNFKTINDTLGHIIGDKVLKDVSEKLQIIFSNYDIISRFGGDEFCVLVKEIPQKTLEEKLKWMLEKLRCDYSNGEKKVTTSVSIGIAHSPDYGTNITFLMQCADKALYKAKSSGKNSFVFFSNSLKSDDYENTRI